MKRTKVQLYLTSFLGISSHLVQGAMYDSYEDWHYTSPEALFCNGEYGNGKCTSIGVGDEACSMCRPYVSFTGQVLSTYCRNCPAPRRCRLPRNFLNCSIKRVVMQQLVVSATSIVQWYNPTCW